MLLDFRCRDSTRTAKVQQPIPASQMLVIGILLVIILTGFRLRLLYAERPYFHPDEYVSIVDKRISQE
jgi:hypothetical protein